MRSAGKWEAWLRLSSCGAASCAVAAHHFQTYDSTSLHDTAADTAVAKPTTPQLGGGLGSHDDAAGSPC